LRASVTATRRDSGLRVRAGDLTLDGFTVEYDSEASDRPDVDVADSLVDAAMGYINGAVTQARDAVGAEDVGFEIAVDSQIPLGAGLGSSAAVVVAAIDAVTRELGVTLDPAEIADRAYQVEYAVQDGQASRADTFCSTMGGAVRVEGDECRTLNTPDLPFVIGYDGGAGDTGELVSSVRELRSEYGFAADTVASIGDLVRQGETALADGDLSRLGELLDFNHGLLSALGVSSRSLDAMVWAARDAGALGAKLTGAGGGGCIVALDETPETETALEYTPGCADAFRAELDTTGVCQEGG
jgi:mevalonate kinase